MPDMKLTPPAETLCYCGGEHADPVCVFVCLESGFLQKDLIVF